MALKLKTHRGARKRFKITANGKIKCGHSLKRHILTKKSPKRKRHLRKAGILTAADTKRVREMLPHA